MGLFTNGILVLITYSMLFLENVGKQTSPMDPMDFCFCRMANGPMGEVFVWIFLPIAHKVSLSNL